MHQLALILRPAVDARPPAEPWTGISPQTVAVSPDQPALALVEEIEHDPLPGSPTPGRTPITVDVDPAGVAVARIEEMTEQARTWAPWFAQLLSEAMEGRRPLESLGRWLDEWVLAEVSRRARLQRRLRSRTPGFTVSPAVVVSLRTQFTRPRVLEVAAHVRRGRRSAAWAFQLVRVGDRWRCTAVALGPTEISGPPR